MFSNIHSKIFQITHDLPAMMKRTPGHNGVKYRKLEDMLEIIVPRLEFHKIILTPSEIKFFETKAASSKKGEIMQHVSYVQRFTFMDTDSGTCLDVDIPTEASDASCTSKACRMANTTAMRTLFETIFLMTESEVESIETVVELPRKKDPPLLDATVYKLPTEMVELHAKAKDLVNKLADFPIETKTEAFDDLVFSAKTPEEKAFFKEIITAIIKKENVLDPDNVIARKIWITVMDKRPLKTELEHEIMVALNSLGNLERQSEKLAS